MDLTQVERSRSDLLQFLIVLIMIFLGVIMLVSYRELKGFTIPILGIVALAACLYAMVRQRSLNALQDRLVKEFVRKTRQVQRLGEEVEVERDKSGDLGLRLREVSELYRAISMVNAVVDYEQTHDRVLQAALSLVDGDSGSIMLLDAAQQNLTIACSHGLEDFDLEGVSRPIGEGVSGWVAKQGEPVLLRGDAGEDGRFTKLAERPDTVRHSMIVPLKYHDEVMGVLNLGLKATQGEDDKFNDYHLRFATIFGQHASVALRNVQLVKVVERHGLMSELGGATA